MGTNAIVARSAAAAYRRDSNGRATAFGESDGGWITVAVLLQHAVAAPPADALRLLRNAVELSETILGGVGRGLTPEVPHEATSCTDSEIIMALAASMEHAGALHLASALLDALLSADKSLSIVEAGRILALLARTAWKVGDVERAEVTYTRVSRLGRSNVSVRI